MFNKKKIPLLFVFVIFLGFVLATTPTFIVNAPATSNTSYSFSGSTTNTNTTIDTDSIRADTTGFQFNTTKDAIIYKVIKESGSNATICSLTNAAQSFIFKNATFYGDVCVLNANISKNGVYRLLMNREGETYTARKGSVNYPFDGSNGFIKFINGTTGSAGLDGFIWGFENITFGTRDNQLTLNWTISATNLNICWYEYDNNNITIPCVNGANNITNFTQMGGNQKSLRLYSNDTSNNLNSTLVNWGHKVFQNSLTFNSATTEGAFENFQINFTQGLGLQTSSVSLVYNNVTNAATYSISDSEVIAIKNLTIPIKAVAGTNLFYWSMLMSDGTTVNTTASEQSISILGIDNCSTFGNLIYNFTSYDEELKTILSNTTLDLEINVYDSSRSLQIVNFSEQYKETNPAQICWNGTILTSVNYSIDSTVKYTSNDSGNVYAIEYHNIRGQILYNASALHNIALYDLKNVDSTEFQLTFRDATLLTSPNILVEVYRQYVQDNNFKIVEIPITDSKGQTVIHLVRNDVIYNFIMKDTSGNIVASFSDLRAFCEDFTIGLCSINLNVEGQGDIFYDRTTDFGISYSVSYSNVTNLISLDFISNNGSSVLVEIQAIRNSDFGNRTACQNSLTAASGTITCNVSDVASTDKFLFLNIFVGGQLKEMSTIDLENASFNFGVGGSFMAFFLMLIIIIMFMEDRQILIVAIVLGWIAVVSMGLIFGSIIGTSAATIWLIVSAIAIIWKLKKEESG